MATIKLFITQQMVELYKQDELDDFLQKRDEYLKSKEQQFVEKLGIKFICSN
ncbi:hypothetical protein [Spirulina subsalsa]|uniref:hypothetical protein n=1 Tax=Spirulina subsalsa TaxID=54311 RepID=UPI00223780A0|nr:hypothetical protein [Spirulina subsalsa]